MDADQILTASTVITMVESAPRGTAVAVEADGTIAAVGDLDTCKKALPDATVTDLGDTALLPGFVESHSHPAGQMLLLNGIADEVPAMMEAAMPLLGEVLKNPLASAAQWYVLMAGNGIRSISEMTYNDTLKPAFETMGDSRTARSESRSITCRPTRPVASPSPPKCRRTCSRRGASSCGPMVLRGWATSP